jgi:hypothetical protein
MQVVAFKRFEHGSKSEGLATAWKTSQEGRLEVSAFPPAKGSRKDKEPQGETKPDSDVPKRDLRLLGALRGASYNGYWSAAPEAPPYLSFRQRPTGQGVTSKLDYDSTDFDRGTPETNLGPVRLGNILDLLLQADYYRGQEDFVDCFNCLDSVWLSCPIRVKMSFKKMPSKVAEDRVYRDFRKYPFENYPIYGIWVDKYERVTNAKYLAGYYLQYDSEQFFKQRCWYIADETACEFIRGFYDALEIEGFDLKVSRRWGLDDSIRAAQDHDDRIRGRNQSSARTSREDGGF